MDENTFRRPEPEDHDLPEKAPENLPREDRDFPASAYIDNAASVFNLPGESDEAGGQSGGGPRTRRISPQNDAFGAGRGSHVIPGDFPSDDPIPPVSPGQGPVPPVPPAQAPAEGEASVAPESDPPEDGGTSGKPKRGVRKKRFYVLLAVCLSVVVLAAGGVLYYLLNGNPFAGTSARIRVSSKMPESTEEIVDFYRVAANAVAKDGLAGFHRKQWQTISDLNLTGIELVDNIISGVLRQYVTPDDRATSESFSRGTREATDAFPAFTLKDLSYVKSASCIRVGDHYQISIVFQHEDTPDSHSSFLGQVTDTVIFWDTQIEPILNGISQLREYEDIHMDYSDVTISAEIGTDGRFISVRHTAPAEISIGSARIGIFTFSNKSLKLESDAEYTDFLY